MTDKHSKYDDEILLSKYSQSHDNYWLGILLQRYTALLLGVCMKYLKNEEEAKDAVQQVFLIVLKEIDRHKVSIFKSWIYIIARNHCLMKIRKGKNTIIAELKEEIIHYAEEQNDRQHLEKEKIYDYIEICLEELNKEQRTCVSLFYLESKTYTQIADSTGFSGDQVKSYIQNGKRNLKNLIIKKQQQDG